MAQPLTDETLSIKSAEISAVTTCAVQWPAALHGRDAEELEEVSGQQEGPELPSSEGKGKGPAFHPKTLPDQYPNSLEGNRKQTTFRWVGVGEGVMDS